MSKYFNNIKELAAIIDYAKFKDIKKDKKDIINIITRGVQADIIYLDSINDITNDNVIINNILNETYGKKNVATIFIDSSFINSFAEAMYCPHCKKNHSNIDFVGKAKDTTNEKQKYYFKSNSYEIKIDKVTCCNCNTSYDVKDLKIINQRDEIICGDMFIDNDKISLSVKYMQGKIKRTSNNQSSFYYEEGYKRVTFNTQTGYTYTTNKGLAYKDFENIWNRTHNTKAPVMFNSTYSDDGNNSIFRFIATSKIIDKLKKTPKEDLMVMANILTDMIDNKKNNIIKEFYTILSEKIQSQFSYKIIPFKDYYDKRKNGNWSIINSSLISGLKRYNRYINVDPFSAASEVLYDKSYELKRNKINREEINILNGLFKTEKVKLGKKAKALTQKEHNNVALVKIIANYGLLLKNPDNIYRLLKASINHDKKKVSRSYYKESKTIKLWLKYRSENYIVNELIKDIENNGRRHNNKNSFMKDALYLIESIGNRIKDFNIDEIVEFKNEKQFHDDVSRYYNSDEYHMLVNEKEYKCIFDLEQEILDLEDIDNHIFISKNRGELSDIGRKMNICVGGYSYSVESGYCRIAYIMNEDNTKYKACLELRPYNKDNTKYELVQAKLKYNRLPYEDMEIYNKIIKWTKQNNIEIHTYDMLLPKDYNEKIEPVTVGLVANM